MLVVTAGTAEYRDIIAAQARVCDACRYERLIFDLGGLGMGLPFEAPEGDLSGKIGDSLPPCTFKPAIMATVADCGKTMCWLDGDCIPLRRFEPEGDWDVAVTLRPMDEIGASGIRISDFLNAGVVWARNGDFIRRWLAKTAELGNDQWALNETIFPDATADQWRAAMGKSIVSPDGCKVAVLDAMEWNCWHLPPKSETRILHFKRGIRAAAKDYCR